MINCDKKTGRESGRDQKRRFQPVKKKPRVINFKKTPVNTENFRKFSRAAFFAKFISKQKCPAEVVKLCKQKNQFNKPKMIFEL